MVQVTSMDSDLRNTLWSLLNIYYWEKFDLPKFASGGRADHISRSNVWQIFLSLWINYFKKPTDTIPQLFYDDINTAGGLAQIREFFFRCKWNQVYDVIELVSEYGSKEDKGTFQHTCNLYLEKENSAYRFINGVIAPISSLEEVSEVEEAIRQTQPQPYDGARQHLQQALVLLKDRENPDYRNSIKESISAVESVCKQIDKSSAKTLGAALSALEQKGKLHPALKKAFSALYGYSNDANGIRHALLEESNLSSAEARFMLVSCSAFINYVIVVVANAV